MTFVHRAFRLILTDARVKLVAAVAVLSILWACYPGSEVTFSNPQESTVNQWLIETRESQAQLELRISSQRDPERGFSEHSTGFRLPWDQLVGLTHEQAMSSGTHVQFQLKRDAGTFNFEGWFKEGNGSGHFTFTPNASFAAELGRQGFEKPTDKQLLSMAMNDVGFALINELKAQGYESLTLDQLVKAGDHGVRLEYVQGLKSLGYTFKSTDQLLRMKDHGVSLTFIRELAGLGFSGLSADELVRTRDHGVTARFINEFMAAGYDRMTLDQWIMLRDHGVTTTFIQELKTLGYSGMQLDDLRRLRDHGVTGSFIQELKETGYDKVPLEQLIRLRDHGVSAAYIRKMKERGYDVSLDEYIRLRDSGTKEE